MENNYYIVPLEDKNIAQYNKLVENELTLVNNGKEFVCKTFVGIEFDLLMSNYPKFTREEVVNYINKL